LAADGYNVCITDIRANQEGCDDVAREIRDMGRKACTTIADVTNREEVRKLIQTSVGELGPLNTMYVCYSVTQESGIGTGWTDCS
jgi:NADP-dependent 3-hydroxy acid dehydrogenase YdfG